MNNKINYPIESDSNFKDELLIIKNSLPKNVANCNLIDDILKSEALETTYFKEIIQDLLNQFNPITCTWTIKIYEDIFNITPNISDGLEDRRRRVIAKIREHSTTTKLAIKTIVESYVAGTINIIENTQDYSFLIDVQSRTGYPKITGLCNIIEEVKPAHLRANYRFSSITDMGLYVANYLYTGENVTIYPKREG